MPCSKGWTEEEEEEDGKWTRRRTRVEARGRGERSSVSVGFDAMIVAFVGVVFVC